MANADRPFGFRVFQTKHNAPARRTSEKTDGSAAIYPGDVVKKDGSGRVLTITAAGDNPIGVSDSYVAATAGLEVFVFDDLVNTIFEVQVDDDSIADDTQNGNFFDITITTGDTTLLQGKQEMDGDASAEDTLILRGLIDRPGNAFGTNAKVAVQFRVDANAMVTTTT